MYCFCDLVSVFIVFSDINNTFAISFSVECLYRNLILFPKSLRFFLFEKYRLTIFRHEIDAVKLLIRITEQGLKLEAFGELI